METQKQRERDDTPCKAGEVRGREGTPGVTAAERAAGGCSCRYEMQLGVWDSRSFGLDAKPY